MNKLLLSLFVLMGWSSAYAQVNPSFTQDEYKKALWMTTRFYGAQRSGHGPNWLLRYHEVKGNINPAAEYRGGKSFIKDADGAYDLTGGWFDCGDHVKFGQTLFYSAYVLILGYSEFPEGYDDHYSFDYSGYNTEADFSWAGKKTSMQNGIPDILDEVKYATDYFQKAIRDNKTFYYQVGDGDADHQQWVTSSYMSTLPKGNGGEANGARDFRKASGNVTSMASFCGATLAAMARLYKKFDPAYAQSCLEKAIVCYEFVNGTTKGNTGGGSFYPAKGEYKQDQVVLYMELYRATGDKKYLTEAETLAETFNDEDWSQYSYLGYNNSDELCFYLLASFGDKQKATAKESWDATIDRYKPASGYLLNKRDSNWGVLRYMGNQAFVYGLNEKMNGNTKTVNPYTITSVDHIFGKNNSNFSFVVGFGSNHVKFPHHRNYYGNNQNVMSSSKTQPGLEFGFMAGAQSDNPSVYPDALIPYEASEGGIDYEAGLVGALGYINSILNPVNIGQFGNPTPDLGDDVSICGVGSVVLDSKIPADGKKKFTWKLNGQTIAGAAGSTYTATQAGEYTCEIDSAGQWNTSGSVNVLGVLPEINLGEEIVLCNPAFVTLDAGVAGNGITYKWYTNDELDKDATGATYEVYKAGTYKCVISATGCSSQSSEVAVTSKLPVVADAISDKNGNVTLTVNGTGSYEWFAAAEGSNPLHAGTSYSTKIDKNTTFYVQDAGSASIKTGPSASTFTGTGVNWGNIGAMFTTAKAVMITGFTVKPTGIYNTEPVSITVDLMKGGTKVKSYTSVAVENKGMQDYVLTFEPAIEIPDAGEYMIKPSDGLSTMFYESGPAYSTYSSPGVITFTGADNGTQANNPFPAIFDWQIQAGSGCARALAKAIYDPDGGNVGVNVLPGGICSLYPNPVKDVLYLNLTCNPWDATQQVSIEVLSTLGNLVKKETTTVEGAAAGINLSELQQGVYLVRIVSGSSVSVKQIIKK